MVAGLRHQPHQLRGRIRPGIQERRSVGDGRASPQQRGEPAQVEDTEQQRPLVQVVAIEQILGAGQAVCGSLEVVTPADAATPSRKKGDFTLLLVDGAVEQLPDSLTGRLAEGGRVVCGVVRNGLTRLATGRKVAGAVALLPLAEIGIPALPEFAAKKGWSF